MSQTIPQATHFLLVCFFGLAFTDIVEGNKIVQIFGSGVLWKCYDQLISCCRWLFEQPLFGETSWILNMLMS